MNGFLKQISLWVVVLIIMLLAVTQFSELNTPKTKLLKEDFEIQMLAGNVDSPVKCVQLDRDTIVAIQARFKDKVEEQQTVEFNLEIEELATLREMGSTLNPPVRFELVKDSQLFQGIIFTFLPILLLVGLVWFFMFRQMQGGSNKAMSFGKSRAKMANQSDKTATFEDVAGVDEAKEELQEVVEFLKDPKKFTRLGGKIPRGVLLIGPPGSGKTLLARAVAGEASVPFFSISGSDFVEMFVGVGASRVRDLFQQGHKHAPCIIFIDEIDAVGRQRGAGMGGGHDEREQTLNQLLVEMDGFNTNDGVILVAATNRPDVLDRALLRPGRFDRQVMVSNPDIKGRKAILDIHLKNQKVPMGESVNTEVLARSTPGFSGADLANMINEAALLAARRSQDLVNMIDFEDAKDRVLMGPARRSLVMSPEEKLSTAYHEVGHTLVARLLSEADPVHKVTIIPRGPTLGVTSMLPKEDKHSISKKHCMATLRVLMAGRAAEEIIFGEFTSGASNDLKVATQRTHAMVCEWGMSEMGPISFGSSDEVFLGRDLMKSRDFSEETASAVDRVIHKYLQEAYDDAKELLIKHKDILVTMSEALYERETLDAVEIDQIIRDCGAGDLLPPEDKQDPPEDGGETVAVQDTPPPIPQPEAKLGDAPNVVPGGDVAPDPA